MSNKTRGRGSGNNNNRKRKIQDDGNDFFEFLRQLPKIKNNNTGY